MKIESGLDSDLGAFINGIAGLKGFSIWHNAEAAPGEEWECSAELENELSETGQGPTPRSALFVTLCELEQARERPVLKLVWSAP